MIVLRPYQSECVEAVFRHFEEHGSVLAVLATGLGKTVIGASVIQQWVSRGMPGRVLWLAHREELIDQAAQAIRSITGLRVSVEMGQSYADEGGFDPAPVVIASVATLARRRRRRRFRPERFGLIVTDEAHHAIARSYRGIYDYFHHGDDGAEIAGNPTIRHLGITATPRRADSLAMGKVFDAVAYDYSIEPAVQDGWLVPVRQAVVVVDDLDLSRVDVVKGDFAQGQLEEELTRKKVLLEMCHPIIRETGTQQALVFCVGVKQAEEMCDVLNDAKPGSSAWVCGETDKELRRRINADFKSGRLQYLCNCGTHTEGFDAAATAYVVMARLTKSLPLYVQCLGRATRPLAGTVDGIDDAASRRLAISVSAKPWATVLDFVGNATLHGESATISAADVLGGRYDDEIKQYAKKRLTESGNPAPIEEELDRADAEIALLREESERKARIVAEVDYRVRYLDGGSAGPAREHDAGRRGEPATHKQVWKLVSLGVRRHVAERYSKRQAGAVIDSLLRKRGER